MHTIGTLIDSSVLKGREPGEVGTYEHLNRDTAISIGNKKKNIYAYLLKKKNNNIWK